MGKWKSRVLREMRESKALQDEKGWYKLKRLLVRPHKPQEQLEDIQNQ
jgi:hypothetical protein